MLYQITTKLREFATKNLNVAADASEEDVRKAVDEAVLSEKITVKQLRDTQDGPNADKVRSMIADEVQKAVGGLKTDILAAISGAKGGDGASATDAPPAAGTAGATKDATADTKTAQPGAAKAAMIAGAAAGQGSQTVPGADIRGVSVVEQFRDEKTAAHYGLSKSPRHRKWLGEHTTVKSEGVGGGRELNMPTPRTKAVAGSWFKFMIAKQLGSHNVPMELRMNELDRKLVEYALHECDFVGGIGCHESSDTAKHVCNGDKMPELYVKALLDDSTSGGLEAVPIEFDDAAIITPLLHGELFPLVEQKTVSRRRIEGFSIANPTVGWGTAEGTAVALFDTASMIAALDTTIFPITGALELGQDFESDAPNDIGGIIVDRYGEVFLKELDNVVANGNGTSQPEGFLVASGTTSADSENDAAGPPTVGDYEELLFALPKEYRDPATRARQVFAANETTYSRARGIAVGASDQRRVFGMDEESYQILGHPYKIQQSIANTKAAFVNLAWYRMYRRSGYQVVYVGNTDAELARANKRLILVRARFGGRLTKGAACAVMADMKS